MISLEKNKRLIVTIVFLSLIAFLTIGDIGEMNLPDGSILFPVFILVSLGVFYFISPDFFSKYRKSIFSVGGIALLYIAYLVTFGPSQQGLIFNLMAIPIPVFIVLWLFERWKWVKTLEAEKEKAELALLKSQVNPHFFFNTLNNLHSLTVKQSAEAPEVILKLSEMMRYTIYEGSKERVTLAEELNYLTHYIDLHKLRYHRIVNIEFNSDIQDDAPVAPLLFIVILENALKHGVESLSESAYLKMVLTSTDQVIHFSVENNYNPSVRKNEHGIGLDNLRKRLDLIYPGSHELTIRDENGNFKVDLRLEK